MLKGASLDVFELEPLPQDSPLWRHPNVYISPHNAAISDAAGGARYIAGQIAAFERGEPLAMWSSGRGGISVFSSPRLGERTRVRGLEIGRKAYAIDRPAPRPADFVGHLLPLAGRRGARADADRRAL